MRRRKRSAINNQGILILAALASLQISKGLNADQLETLSAFFEVLGDNLALLIAPPCPDGAVETERTEERPPLSSP